MLDLLAAISSVDPPSLLAWLVFLFAASGYPIGIMLGSTCSPCCGQKCSGPCSNDAGCPPGCQCVGGQCVGSLPCVGCDNTELPDTVTVSVSGWPATRVQGGDLANLVFDSNFGSGAAGKVTAPGGDNPGPVSAVELSYGGEGYARISRIQPTLTASAGGTQAFTVSVEQVGEGAEAVWSVTGLSLNGGGTTTGNIVSFSAGTGVVVSPASARLIRQRTAPSLSVTVTSSGGAGADLVATFYQTESVCDFSTVWALNGITINNGGTGYAPGDQVQFSVTNGLLFCGYYETTPWVVKAVGAGGAITQFELDTNDKDIIDNYRAEYYAEGGTIEAVVLDDGGAYYANGGVEQAAITVTVNQRGITGASGAVITAGVDLSPSSPTFGNIVSLTITNAGTGYLAWKYIDQCCGPAMNGRVFVLKRPAPYLRFGRLDACVYGYEGFGKKGCTAYAEVAYSQASVRVDVFDGGNATSMQTGESTRQSFNCFKVLFATPSSGESCVQFPFTVTDTDGITIKVEAGGDYVPYTDPTGTQTRHSCCPDGGLAPAELYAKLYFPAGFDSGLKENTFAADENVDSVDVVFTRGNCGPAGACDCQGLSYGFNALHTFYLAVSRCDDYFFPNCQHCDRKCETRAGYADDYVNYPADHWYSQYCQNCQELPMCKPASGMYVLRMVDPRFPYAAPQPGDDTDFWRIEVQE